MGRSPSWNGPKDRRKEAVHAKAQMFQDALHLAVLALAQTQRHPGIVTLHPVELGLDRPVFHPIHDETVCDRIEPGLIDHTMGTATR